MPNHVAPIEFLESILGKMEAESALEHKISAIKQAPEDRQKTEKPKKKYKVYRELYFDLLD